MSTVRFRSTTIGRSFASSARGSSMTNDVMTQPLLDRLQRGSFLLDGAMGSLLYERGVLHTRSYDELNVSQPELIRTIHHDYVRAGAELVETNTFRANRVALAKHGLIAGADAILLETFASIMELEEAIQIASPACTSCRRSIASSRRSRCSTSYAIAFACRPSRASARSRARRSPSRSVRGRTRRLRRWRP